MKVTLLPENISLFIPLINKILPSHSQLPILSNVLLEATNEGLLMKATDLEMGVQVTIPAKIEKLGAVTVPGKEFLETISSLPKDKIEMGINKDIFTIVCRGNKISFNTISKEEFPQLFKEKGVEVDRFTRKEFLEIFPCLTFSVSLEETRPQLGGVYVDAKGSYTNFVSTDGYRMSVKKVSQKNKEREGLIIPVGLINEAIGLKSDVDLVLYVNKAENQVIFEVGDAIIVGRMIEGEFPNYEKVLPVEFITTVVFDREELLQNVRLASVFAKENSNIATLEVVGNTMKLSTRTQGVGEGEMVIECDKTGEDNKIAFNIRYLSDVLKNQTSEELVLGLNSSTEPAVFTTKDKDFSHVIMPIQVD
jgi:DNA polymerase-3 subunit beta